MNFTSTQKKVIGLLITIFFLILNAFLLVMLIASVVLYPEDASQNSFQFIFCMGLFSFPLFYGLRMYKAGKSELIQLSGPIDREKTLRMNVHISFPDYRKLMIQLIYKNPIILFPTLIGLGMILPPSFMDTEFTSVSFIGLVFISLPLVGWVQARRYYNSNKPLKEKVEYVFTIDNIIVTGETFNTSLWWSSLHKVKEMRNWFLLYTNHQVAFIIPKTNLTVDEILTFKSFVINAKGVLKEF